MKFQLSRGSETEPSPPRIRMGQVSGKSSGSRADETRLGSAAADPEEGAVPARWIRRERVPGPERSATRASLTRSVGLPLLCRFVMRGARRVGSAAGNFDAASASRRFSAAANSLAGDRVSSGSALPELENSVARRVRYGATSITRTPSGGSNRNSASGGSVLKRISVNATFTTLPRRSTTRVARTSPLPGSTSRKSFS